MRIHGTLRRWNDERGFGFIAPSGAGEEVFVHVRAFPRDGTRPSIGELVSFETELRGDGKKQAVRVMRPGGTARPMPSRRPDRAGPSVHRHVAPTRRPWLMMAALIAIFAVVVYAYVDHVRNRAGSLAPAQRVTPDTTSEASDEPYPSTPPVAPTNVVPARSPARLAPRSVIESAPSYQCRGRTRCSQMTSCAEATWVLENCPGTRMDGDHDGVPCESQWCVR